MCAPQPTPSSNSSVSAGQFNFPHSSVASCYGHPHSPLPPWQLIKDSLSTVPQEECWSLLLNYFVSLFATSPCSGRHLSDGSSRHLQNSLPFSFPLNMPNLQVSPSALCAPLVLTGAVSDLVTFRVMPAAILQQLPGPCPRLPLPSASHLLLPSGHVLCPVVSGLTCWRANLI